MTWTAAIEVAASVAPERASWARPIGTPASWVACASPMTTMKLRITEPRARRHDVECTSSGCPSRFRDSRLTTSTGSSSAPTSRYQGSGPHGPASSGTPALRRRTKTSACTGPSVAQTGISVVGSDRLRPLEHLRAGRGHVVDVLGVILHRVDHLVGRAADLEAAVALDHECLLTPGARLGHGHVAEIITGPGPRPPWCVPRPRS